MNKILFTITLSITFLFTGCFAPIPKPIKINTSAKKVDYLRDVKPILDKRCVTCHSCYNSPCQAKFSSYEGIDRGASKLLVYDALRLKAAKPTRLFIDAKNTEEWRKKGFFSITSTLDTNASYNSSIMMYMLHDKKEHPKVIGSYKPEADKLVCPRNRQEMGDYLDDKPNHGMPYGFTQLKDKEYTILTNWIAQGAKGPDKKSLKRLKTPSDKAAKEIKKWETFFNKQDPKHSVTARYLYEHLFLAHLHFKDTGREFYKLVRSKTPFPQKIEIIPTVRPFDDPKVDKFYYRLEKIYSTIVHKTHMVFELDDKKMDRIKKLFIQTKWIGKPHYIDYETKTSANPFVAFAQIPVKSRYQFLLNNSHYIVMTFIRGPVCRGQMALNVIHDHFWVMFQDPKYDVSVTNPNFLLLQADNLSMPIETSTQSLLETFSDKYRDRYRRYFIAKQKLYRQMYPKGQGLEAIWKGDRAQDAPLLTIYRHFDSASVQKGVVGELPRTMWVIDYPQFERIYYALVAGYNVFGNISHQTNIRRYMDFLRLEGEINFISYMPNKIRVPMLKSWYINSSMIKDGADVRLYHRDTSIVYKTKHPKTEFIEAVVRHHILKSTNIHFDKINYYKEGVKPPKMPKKFNSKNDLINGLKSLTAPGTEFVKHLTDNNINTIMLRIKIPNREDNVGTIVINRWHDNVDSMFNEKGTLNSSLDTLDFIDKQIGSYPNMFAVVDYKDLPDFFDLIKNFDGSERYIKKAKKYFIQRGDSNFWQTYDWFQKYFNKKEPIKSGLYDLNRYYDK